MTGHLRRAQRFFLCPYSPSHQEVESLSPPLKFGLGHVILAIRKTAKGCKNRLLKYLGIGACSVFLLESLLPLREKPGYSLRG